MKFRNILLLLFFLPFFLAAQNCYTQTSYPDCNQTPENDTSLTASTPVSGSHQFGEDCLTGCHISGGSALTVWSIAGSLESSQGSGSPAVAGAVISGIGSELLELTVDVCGNFYTTIPVTSLTSSRPTTINGPASGMQTVSWGVVSNPGSCNQTACHNAGAQGFIY